MVGHVVRLRRLSVRLVSLAALTTLLPSCGWIEAERQEAAAAARAETWAEAERALREGVLQADRIAGRADRTLSPMPVMTPAEEARLRRYLGSAHVVRARAVGERVTSEAARDSLVAAGRLVVLEDSTTYRIVREGTSPAYVVPAMAVLLDTLGARFQRSLGERGLPAYRIEVTSALRTSEHQARLRRTNANAAAGVSSHEFGTTVDLSYAAFAPPAETPLVGPPDLPSGFRAGLGRMTDLALESVSARKSRELGKIFSRVLAEAQDEGLALVIYERQQTVWHVTVAR